VLSYDGIVNLNWTWFGTDPFQWRVEVSPDGSTGWSQIDLVAGNLRTWVESFSDFYRVMGVNSSNVVITPISNVVEVT